MAKSFRELLVWQKAIELTTQIYKLTQRFPREETYGLSSQLRRAGVSVASNIAEGNGRRSRAEYRNFPGIARGSALEIQTQLVIATNLGFGDPLEITKAEQLAEETSKMIWAISNKL
ncbi:MAG TPA: four helix bundle protein [Acidobacteriaceae bacterium]|jgi:four helix bundle protein|nr:four helix bundle protein [Acidobacteriaceae bacterium]